MVKYIYLMLRKLKNWFHLVESIFWNIYFDFPGRKLRLIGVTGTDGKTTTVSLIYWILRESGHKVAKMTTVGSEINGEPYSVSLHTTTPHAKALQRFLRDALSRGSKFAVIEVSSHAIDQNRIWGILFEIGVLTNVTNNEHLDYHGSFENYRKTKLGFITSCKHQVVGSGSGTGSNKFEYKTRLIGRFNQDNILLAVAACRILGVSEDKIRLGIETFEAPPGRLELIIDSPFKVIVDFAHTPGAFEKVLPVAAGMKRSAARNILIHVFGATGDRDKSKRPLMAEIASKYDDYVFLTHEDTYLEDKTRIIDQLEEGFAATGYVNYKKVIDRKDAIEKALKMAKPGDVVILTGVGHQKTMNIGGKEVPFNEKEIIRRAVNDKV